MWGGKKGRPERTALLDGALFSLRDLRWEVLPEAPLDPRSQPSLVSNRKRLFVWGGFADLDPLDDAAEPPLFADGAEYLLHARRWEPLPPSPLAPRANHVAFGIGEGFGVWGGDEVHWRPEQAPRAFADGARYDSLLRTWTPLAACPLRPRHFRRSSWTGRHLLVWGGSDPPEEVAGRRRAEGEVVGPFEAPPVELHDAPEAAAYDPEGDEWIVLPAPPSTAGGARHVWIDGRMILLGLNASVTVWDVFGGTWRIAPRAPIRPGALEEPTASLHQLSNAALVLIPEQSGETPLMRAWLYSPSDLRWLDGGLTPIVPRLDAAVAGNSNEVFVWSGAHPSSPAPLADGFLVLDARRDGLG